MTAPRPRPFSLAVVVGGSLATVLAAAQLGAETWIATSLHPAGTAGDSRAVAAFGGQQVGGFGPGSGQAALWNGSSASFVDLTPPAAGTARLKATAGTQQVGSIYENAAHAGIWFGSVASFVDLHPATAGSSSANATDGVQQAGSASFNVLNTGYHDYACIWFGTAGSFTNLHPAGADASAINATRLGQQAGTATFSDQFHAAIWAGTKESFRDLHPAGADRSQLYATTGSQQVGEVLIANRSRAAIWAGTRETFVDVAPAGDTDSRLYATNGGRQVGFATFGAVQHAGIWAGTAASFVDLHASLPAGYTSSSARGVTTNGGVLQVVGEAYNATAHRLEAFLWTQSFSVPSVQIAGKKSRTTTAAKLVLHGRALDADQDLARIEVKVGHAKWKKARGLAKWRFVVRLKPGRNLIKARAVDATGNISRPVKLTVTRNPILTLP